MAIISIAQIKENIKQNSEKKSRLVFKPRLRNQFNFLFSEDFGEEPYDFRLVGEEDNQAGNQNGDDKQGDTDGRPKNNLTGFRFCRRANQDFYATNYVAQNQIQKEDYKDDKNENEC